MKRHQLTHVRIERMALCAWPAQAGATIVVAKRRPETDADDVAKGAVKDGESEDAYVARYMNSAAMVKEFPNEKQRAAALHSMYRQKTAKSEGDDSMATDAELKAANDAAKTAKDAETKAVADAAAAKARADKLAALSTDEHAMFKSLPAEKQDAFLALDGGARANEITKSKDADPVVYTAKSGRVFRKSAGEALIEMAKSLDEQAAELAKAKSERDETLLKSRAQSRFSKTSLTVAERVGLLRMLDGGVCADEALRKSIESKLDLIDADLAKSYARAGVSGDADLSDDSPGAKIDKLVKARMKDKNEDEGTATVAVSKSAEGRALYRQISGAAREREMA